ncbi:probable DNA double-strand break repair Rad50 ATPase [Stegodyphus dumicola]|uniref:probable DNA double-strand break repair Rad50 ATPase n=1 Tax=Stegodyphus dumicola TaxID=202533 RepID=UPI0015A9CCD9|nr:probable DNA double-strand break repair Rad50 ATPase [Stegodyphus dumicola]
MLSGKFTILELVDLALRVPEIGAVNFNILHTVLTNIILQTGLEKLKPLCHIQDEVLAQAAITKARMEEDRQKGQTERPGKTVAELKDRIKAVDLPKPRSQSAEKVSESSSSETEDKSKEDISFEDVSEEMTQDEAEKDISVEDVLEKAEPDETEEDISVEDATKKAVTDEDQIPEKVDESEGVPDVVESDLTLEDDAAKAKEKIEGMVEDLGSLAQDILDETSGEQLTAEALQALADEKLVEGEPSQVIAEMWRAININRRMDAAEQGLRELSSIVDVMLDKVQEVEDETVSVVNKTKAMFEGLDNFLKKVKALEEKLKSLEVQLEESNEMTRSEVIRLEEMINEIQSAFDTTLSEIEAALKDLESRHSDLEERVAFKEDLEELKNSGRELLETQVKELKKRIREVQDMIISKEDFMELVTRVEVVEETKVSREELGRLLEPGFIDNFIAEQERLREDFGELKEFVNEINEDLTALKTRIDEEILKSIEASFADIRSHIDIIEEKLATLDADDINDTFARLEEQLVMILKDLEENKAALELYNKEAKSNFKKIQDVNTVLDRLETRKADKEKMYEMLALKADIELVGNKLDRSEFVAVIEDIKDDVERLTITVKINEEEMNENVLKIRRELSIKMYTEDFITATEPIRNRIKAILYEQVKIKQIALTHLFPDAPGIAKRVTEAVFS